MESAITLIADGCLYYRGQDAVALSEDHGLEQVAELIWTGSMTEGTDQELPRLFEVPAEIGSYGVPSARFEADKQWSPALAFGIALQRAATGDPAAYDLRTAGVTRTGARILRLMVTRLPLVCCIRMRPSPALCSVLGFRKTLAGSPAQPCARPLRGP